jgi:hypothetical protein
MKESIKQQRVAAKLAEWLKKSGVDPTKIEEVKADISEVVASKGNASRDLESVLLFLEAPPKRFIKKICKQCDQEFATSYKYVSYCSDRCRAIALKEMTGIVYNLQKPEAQRWGSEQFPLEPPLVIPPAALKTMVRFAHHILSFAEESQTQQIQEVLPVQTEPSSQIEIPEETTPQPEASIPHTAHTSDFLPLLPSFPGGFDPV